MLLLLGKVWVNATENADTLAHFEVENRKKCVWDDDEEHPDEKREADAGPKLEESNAEESSGLPRETESIASSSSKAAPIPSEVEPQIGSVKGQQQKHLP